MFWFSDDQSTVSQDFCLNLMGKGNMKQDGNLEDGLHVSKHAPHPSIYYCDEFVH